MVSLPVGYVKERVAILSTLQHTVFIIKIQLQVSTISFSSNFDLWMKSLKSIIPVFALLFPLLLSFLLKKFNTTVTRGLLIFPRTKGFIFDQRLSKGLLGR